jgi:hypothetical protein
MLPATSFAKPDEPPAANATDGKPPPTPEQVKEARVHFERGTALFKDFDFKLALIEYKRAYELAPNYKILYNIGQVSLQLNNYADAMRALERYLREGGKEIPAKRRQDVEHDIAGLKSRTAFITIKANVEGVTIEMDDNGLGAAPVNAALVDAGSHKIVASKEGYVTVTKSVTLAPGDESAVNLELSPVPVTQEKIVERHEYVLPPNLQFQQPPPPPPNYLWIGWVGAGAFAVGGIVTGALALSAKSTLNSDIGGPTSQQTLSNDATRARTFGIVSDVLVGAAVVTAGATLYFTLKKPSPKVKGNNMDLKVGFSPGAVSVAASY